MIRDSEDFDLRGEFAPRYDRLDFDIVKPSEPISPGAIYSSPGGAVSEDFSPPQPYFLPMAPRSVYIPPGPPAKYIYPRPLIETKGQVSAPGKNFLDIFFDWLNKILS